VPNHEDDIPPPFLFSQVSLHTKISIKKIHAMAHISPTQPGDETSIGKKLLKTNILQAT
jgi:hypothetical protein